MSDFDGFLNITFPDGFLEPWQMPPREKCLDNERRTPEQFQNGKTPVLCDAGHAMRVIGSTAVQVNPPRIQFTLVIKYCGRCDRYKKVAVAEADVLP